MGYTKDSLRLDFGYQPTSKEIMTRVDMVIDSLQSLNISPDLEREISHLTEVNMADYQKKVWEHVA